MEEGKLSFKLPQAFQNIMDEELKKNNIKMQRLQRKCLKLREKSIAANKVAKEVRDSNHYLEVRVKNKEVLIESLKKDLLEIKSKYRSILEVIREANIAEFKCT